MPSKIFRRGSSLATGISAVRQRIWRSATPIYFRALREGLPRLFPPARPDRDTDAGGIRVVGLLSTATGIGQSSRLCLDSLRRDGHRVATHSLSTVFQVDDRVPYDPSPSKTRGGLSIFHLNPPMLMVGILAAGPRRYRRSRNVAYCAWELPQLPPEWRVSLSYVDAVLVPSTFCRDAIAAEVQKPVLVVAHPIAEAESIAPRDRGSKFRVLTVFNCGSSLYRKNPAALIQAFRRAFGDDPDAELVLKIADGRSHKADVERLHRAIGSARNIRIVDALMSETELDGLLRSADVYASLHRSEGFGLTVAEAIMREIPVIVTGWSGTVDFCPPDLAYVVDYELAPITDPHPVYSALQHCRWAEPSIENAARHLIAIRNDRAGAQLRARRLREVLKAHLATHSYAKALTTLGYSAPVVPPTS